MKDSEALREGSGAEALAALRARLAGAIVEAEPRELPALVREFRAVLREQDADCADPGLSVLDQLRERREKRSG